uniref:Uncharacterized protein n=1 Tax=Ixodes ricinus TaxID=34613 RepID=A0A147BS90_IXORI
MATWAILVRHRLPCFLAASARSRSRSRHWRCKDCSAWRFWSSSSPSCFCRPASAISPFLAVLHSSSLDEAALSWTVSSLISALLDAISSHSACLLCSRWFKLLRSTDTVSRLGCMISVVMVELLEES